MRWHTGGNGSALCARCARAAAIVPCVVVAPGGSVRAVEQGANFGRDTDTIATMAGAICGALAGATAIPSSWVGTIGLHNDDAVGAMAGSLVRIAREKARA